MRSTKDNGSFNHGQTVEISSSNSTNFDFHKGNGTNGASRHRTALGKPTPSKWDDAQKWLTGLSRGGDRTNPANQPRNSNADDRRLIAPVPLKEKSFFSSSGEEDGESLGLNVLHDEGVTKREVDCDESFWRINRLLGDSSSAIRSVCVRDMGTEMTPIASQQPSRSGTPLRATTPAFRSPLSSRSSSPGRCQQGGQSIEGILFTGTNDATRWPNKEEEEPNASKIFENKKPEQHRKPNPLETRAMAWDEAERAKYAARRNVKLTLFPILVKAERLKSRAQEKLLNKLAATRRIAEERRANAEAKLNEQAVRTSEKADYIRRTGHLPSSCSFKLPSFCW
ncbi:hypothetical protein GIB67_009243 [Kingdonia uniflora]|uniref:Remorin C-terminal domain-containing protein n=1 Tax=Kingdonia uniflora TaxID=39325 RepID=A0A7J7N2T1_9MAGN|nr:hypothetical protein GIB67_009243 [Kingdonia uniflora]